MTLVTTHAARAFAHLLRLNGEAIAITPVNGTDVALSGIVTAGGIAGPGVSDDRNTDEITYTVRVLASTLDAAMTTQGLTARAPGEGDLITIRGEAFGVRSGRLTTGSEYQIQVSRKRLTSLGVWST